MSGSAAAASFESPTGRSSAGCAPHISPRRPHAPLTRPVIDLADHRFVEGTEESRRQAREEAAEQIRLYQAQALAMRSQLPEIPRSEITPRRFGMIRRPRAVLRRIRGQVSDPPRSSAVAFFVDSADEIVWLERPGSGTRTRAASTAAGRARATRRPAEATAPVDEPMSAPPRDKLWYWLHDQDGQVAEIERRLDRLDVEIDALTRVRFEETKARLEQLGIDVSNYKPPPHIHRSEQRCTNHLRPADDVEALIVAAQEGPLDLLYREHVAAKGEEIHTPPGAPLRRYFPAEFTVR